MRANSLTNLGVAVDYNIASDYDKVLIVAGLAEEIEALAPYSSQIGEIVANLPDVLTVQQAVAVLSNLSVVVTTLEPGVEATSELVGTEIRLGVPRGVQGIQGEAGPKGDKGDKGDIGLTGAQGPIGLTGPQGPRGLRGNDGEDGVSVTITSIVSNVDKSITLNFSDGTQHTTDPVKGQDGTSVTVASIINNSNGTMQINFSDGTSHTTADLTGPRGFKGDTGDSVHHVRYQRSKDPLGNEVGPIDPGQPGYTDVYSMWSSQEELPDMYIGEFQVHNGLNGLAPDDQAKLGSMEWGATSDQVAFEVPYDSSTSGLVANSVQVAIDILSASTIKLSEKSQPNGVASLDGAGKVPSNQLPSYVDDVVEVTTKAGLPTIGEVGKIYVVVADETSGGNTSTYRWTGAVYAMVSNTLNASDVKSLYESNANTNAFTDADVTNLNANTAARHTHANKELLDGINQDLSTTSNVEFSSIKVSGGTGTQGTMSWNTEDETVDLVVSPDVTYQIGQELGLNVRNLTGSTITNGTVVRVTGASGNKITVGTASNSDEALSSATLALVTETIGNNSTGKITTEGLVRGLNTSTLVEGTAIWLGTNGSWTAIKPVTPAHLVHLGWVVRSHATEGSIYVKISNGWELEELHDVLITDIAAGEVMQWNGSYWENRTLSEAGASLVSDTGTLAEFNSVINF